MRTVYVLTGSSLAAGAIAAMALLFNPYPFIGIAGPDTPAAAKPSARAVRPPPLFGADGTPQPALPQAVPADPQARTRVALYATHAQAHALEAELDGAVIWVEAGCCDERAVTAAIDRTDELRTGRNLALDAPVFITGKNLQLAATVVDRLTDEGHTEVFLVSRQR